MPLPTDTRGTPPLGSPIALRSKPLVHELWGFRARRGYGGPFIAYAAQDEKPRVAQPPSLQERITETRELLADPELPRPQDSFDAFCVLLHLFMGVENKYFGPYNPRQASPERSSLYKGGAFFTAKRSASAVIGLQREFCFLLDHEKGIEIAQRGSLADMPFEVAEHDRYAPLRSYIYAAARAAAPGALPAKDDRLEQFFAALAGAPAPEDRLQALVLVNTLLGAMENRHPSLAGVPGPARMMGVLPYAVQQSDAWPGADILLSLGHAVCYYADGTVEVYARDPGRDIKEGPRTVSIVLKTLIGRREGLSAARAEAELSPA